jgi:NAD+ kinase
VIRYVAETARGQELEAAFARLGLHDSLAPDVCLVLGGDGTLLRAIHQHGAQYAYLGINCGYLGFLMNDLGGDANEVARAVAHTLEAEGYVTHGFPRLQMRAITPDGDELEGIAVNDVYVERQSGQTCHLRVTVDGVEAVHRMVCDGIIAATPLGSTAYSFSAGGPAAHPLVRATQLTAICPHTPRLAPLVLPHTSPIHIEVLDSKHRPARCVIDGQPLGNVEQVDVRGADVSVRLCFLDGHDFTRTMFGKIIHA